MQVAMWFNNEDVLSSPCLFNNNLHLLDLFISSDSNRFSFLLVLAECKIEVTIEAPQKLVDNKRYSIM